MYQQVAVPEFRLCDRIGDAPHPAQKESKMEYLRLSRGIIARRRREVEGYTGGLV